MNSMKRILTVCAAALALAVSAAELAPVKVSGNKLVANGKELRLRGINWGWWHLKGTEYTEADMKRQAGWGANMLRLAMTYTDVIHPDGSWNEDAFRKVDEVVKWAQKHKQYVILDLHVAPGGQDPAPYCDGGKNLIWKDKTKQEQYFDLWRGLAKRYRGNPAVAAYEVMNEPCTQQADPRMLADLNRKAIAEIRKIDPDKVIVVSGDQWGNARDLKDEVKIDDPNILYTFHFYEGGSPGDWLRNVGEGPGGSGTADWVRFEIPVKTTNEVTNLSILLRSNKNSGTAWFDDIELVNQDGYVMQRLSFDRDAKPFQVERDPRSVGAYDPKAGHNKPGSLRLSGTGDYNGWVSPRFAVHPNQTYKVVGWMKLENATGSSFIAAALFGAGSTKIDTADLRSRIRPALDFAKKYNVPLWVGEFSAARNCGPEGYQAASVAERIKLFE
ncbi:MAG: glycoside hydrolase family 5 protein, partial [Lentisphaeria bacterium]|nr:glycoside hydrolase family 5 protein [Lentisphaeria bacterium]